MTLLKTNTRVARIVNWQTLVHDDLAGLEAKMLHAAHMGHETLDGAVELIIRGGGKRVRPSITFLAGKIFNADPEDILSVAASVELLHTATLVHDDLIDGSPERRGVPTLHSKLSAGVTVLTGDFLFAKAAALAAEANSVRVVKLFSDTLVRICQGEILQAQTRWQVPSYDVYIERIYGKTAALFEAAASAAALVGDAAEDEITALAQYGRSLGLAFQIVDDALDFVSTTQRLGKPAGNDMQQGILNLPVMFYIEQGKISADALLARLEAEENLPGLLHDIRASGVIEQSLQIARNYIEKANRQVLSVSTDLYANALHAIGDYVIQRDY